MGVARDGVRALRALAKVHGIQRRWRAAGGEQQTVGDETLLAIVRMLGAPVERVDDAPGALRAHEATIAATTVEPVLVQWGNRTALTFDVRLAADANASDVHVLLDAEDGTKREWGAPDRLAVGPGATPYAFRVTLPAVLPYGVHRLHVDGRGVHAEAVVLAAPRKMPASPRAWGVFAPVYALHGTDQRATGDLATFERFAHWAGAHGARVLGTLPLLATFFGAGDEPTDPSPYAPVSRRYWNEAYLDLSAVPELDDADAVAPVAEPSPGPLVDLPRLARARRPVLETAVARLDELPARRAAFGQWLDRRPDVMDYARFRAAVERAGPGAAVDTLVDEPAARYHAYVQWLADEQLGALAERLHERDQELYLDLPIGAHPSGFDVANEDGLFARGAAVGAPPDSFFDGGQNWGFPPVLPGAARANGHRYLRECLGAHLRVARRLRVDHILGFHRMWWVPDGASARDGAYVSYPAEEQYAALVLAATRAGAGIVGENLGTVPPATNAALRRHNAIGMYVVPFEFHVDGAQPLRAPTARELACIDTHDTATFATWWSGLDAFDRDVLAAALGTADTEPGSVLGALLAYLGASDAAVVLASLEDLWLETEPQNLPGTTNEERANFGRRFACSLDDIEASTSISALLQRLDHAREEGRTR
jgi:4-alpha-glucanotransferase